MGQPSQLPATAGLLVKNFVTFYAIGYCYLALKVTISSHFSPMYSWNALGTLKITQKAANLRSNPTSGPAADILGSRCWPMSGVSAVAFLSRA